MADFRFRTVVIVLTSALMLLTACNKGASPASEAVQTKPGIPWFGGSVDGAFALARQSDKPLFLYWGAVWCPPCEEIKQTVFKDPGFIAQSELFVPVYLDGDTPRAQTWGERFAVQGYPTMIVFNPAGEEVTRIPGAIDVERYNTVLQLSLNGLKKTSELIERALRAPSDLSREDYTQLAYYAWDQQNLDGELEADPALLRKLASAARRSDNELAASRLYLQSLIGTWSREESLPEAQQVEAREELRTILSDQSLTLANHDFSMFWSEEIMRLIAAPGETRRELSSLWARSMTSVRRHPSLSKAEQLGSWYPELHLFWLNNPDAESMPEDRLSVVRKHVARMDESTRGSARQTVINKAYQVLQAAHLYDESRALLLAEVEKSQAPYYFMSGLASLEEKQKNYDAASAWLEKAYGAAEGKATRFQWGVEYVTGLIRMQPEREDEIVATTTSLLDNLDRDQDVFTGRNFGRLQTLRQALKEWQTDEQRRLDLKPFNSRLTQACAAADPESLAHQNCTGLKL